MLGAGSSRAATESEVMASPLATEFFHDKYLKEYWHSGNFDVEFQESPLYFILGQYFGKDTRRPTRGFNRLNVEEVYSFLQSYDRVFQSTSHRAPYFLEARRQLREYVILVVRYTSGQAKRCGYLERLANHLTVQDSIVTFNWDTLIERALAKSKNSAASKLLASVGEFHPQRARATWTDRARMEERDRGKLIKLHGSVTFTACENDSCARHAFPYVWEFAVELPEYWSCLECGAPCSVMILPPHGAKSYSANSFFRLQANIAAGKLAMATRIVLIGYSIPVFDIEARSMLRSARLDDDSSEAWLSEVVVVNPQVRSRRYVSEVRDLLGIDRHAAHGHEVAFNTFSTIDEYMEFAE